MAKSLLAAESIAPTHPHPAAKTTAMNYVAGPIAGIIDRTRDAIKGAGTSVPGAG
jgi:hypothetical protein